MTEVESSLSPVVVSSSATLMWGHKFVGAARPKSRLHRVEGSVLRRYENSGAKAAGVQLASFIADKRHALPSRQLLPFKVYTEVADKKLVFEVDPHDTELWHRRLAANISRCIGSPYMVQLSIAGPLSRSEPLLSNHEGLERLMEAGRYDLHVTVPCDDNGEPVPDERELPSRPNIAVTTVYMPVASPVSSKSSGSGAAAGAALPKISAEAARAIQDRLTAYKKQLAQHIAAAVTAEHYTHGNNYDVRTVATAVANGLEATRLHEQSFCREAHIADAGLLATNVGSALQESLCKMDMERLLSAASVQGKSPQKTMESVVRKTVEKDGVWQLVAAEAKIGGQVAENKNIGFGFGLFSLFGKTRCVRPAQAVVKKCTVARPQRGRLYVVRSAAKCTSRTHYSEYSDDDGSGSSSGSDSDGSSSSSSDSEASLSSSDNDAAGEQQQQQQQQHHRHCRRRRRGVCHHHHHHHQGKKLTFEASPLSTTTTTAAPSHVTNIVYNDNSRRVINSKNKRVDNDSSSDDDDGGDNNDGAAERRPAAVTRLARSILKASPTPAVVELSPSVVGAALCRQQQQASIIDLSPEVLGSAIIASATGVVLTADAPTVGESAAKKPMTSLATDIVSDDDNDGVVVDDAANFGGYRNDLTSSSASGGPAFVNDSRSASAADAKSKTRLLAVSFAPDDNPNVAIYDDSDLLAMIDRPGIAKKVGGAVQQQEEQELLARTVYIRAVNTSAEPRNVVVAGITQPLATQLAPGAHTPFVRYTGVGPDVKIHFEPAADGPSSSSASSSLFTQTFKMGASVTHLTVSPYAVCDDSAVHASFPADKPLASNSRIHVTNVSDKQVEVNIANVASFALRPAEQRVLYVPPGQHIIEHRLEGDAAPAQWAKIETVLHMGNAYSLLVNGRGRLVQVADNRNAAQKQALCDKFLANKAVRAFIDSKAQCKGTLFVPINAAYASIAASEINPSDYYCAHTNEQHIEKTDSWGNVPLTSDTGRTYTLVDNKRALLTRDGKKIAVHGMWTTEANPLLVMAAIDGTHEQFSETRLL